MSLGVTIIDKVHQKVLNEGGKKYGILIDDSISDIKTKIFVNTDDFYKETIMYYPNLVRLQIDDSKIMDNSNLSLNYSSIPKKPIVYVTSIFDIIVEKQKYYDFDLEPYKLYMDFKNDNDVIYELYEKLSEEFTDLTQDDFHMIIKMKIFNFNKSSESPIISSDESSNIMKDIKNFFNTIKNEYDTQVQKYKREKDLLTDFYKQVYSYKSGDYYKANESNFIYTTINFTFASKDHDSSISGKFIKLLQIFNLIELSDEIPLVIFNDSPRKDPKIKIYNRLVNTLNESTIRSLILNEKKKLKKETYKKVRGLMFKCKIDLKTSKPQNSYMTVLLNENGVMNVKINFEEEDDQRSFESIKDKLCESIDNLVETLNSLYGVFTQSKRLMRCEDMNWGLVSISSLLETDKKINKAKFKKMLTKYEGSRIFDGKDIKDIISMYYKRFGRRDSETDIESERLGITVNIRDNPYKLNSSTIVIYGSNHFVQLQIIVDEIIVLSQMSEKLELKKNIYEDDESEEEEVVLKERKQNVKKIREAGGKASSITCQKNRQPKIDNETEITDSELVLVYKDNKYVCEGTGEHKYPGFTKDGIPCCFKNIGKGMESIISSEILEIKVQPSNYTVDIIENPTGKTFTTFVIKITSENLENIDLSHSRYFYLDPTKTTEFPLVHIHNQDLIDRIQRDETNNKNESIWLTEVPLYQLISKPNKNTCLFIPNLHKATKDNINEQCQHHSKEHTFGYNIKSYPCCFENKPVTHRVIKQDKASIIKQHIITTDKLLGHKRQGILQPGLNELFNEIVSDKSGAFLRWGVNQNQLSFLNCIIESISNRSELKIDTTYSLKRFLSNFLINHPNQFLKLNNGNISLRYGNLQEYLNVLNSETAVDWSDIIDLVQIALECNVLILDIPYVEKLSKTTFVYKDMRLVCNLNIKYDLSKPFILLIKKQNAFELIVRNSSAIWNKKSEKMQISETTPIVDFVFKYDTLKTPHTNIVNFFVDYYKTSCVKENKFPDKYPYEELYDAKYIIERSSGNNKILVQLVNPFNKINFLVTKRGLIIPVKETGILDKTPSVLFNDFVLKDKVINIEKMIDLLNDFNKQDISPKMKFLGITVDSNDMSTGVLTNFGQTLPTKKIPVNKQINIPVLKTKYYSDVDLFLSGKDKKLSSEVKYNQETNDVKDKMFMLKKSIGKNIVGDENAKQTIININKDPLVSKRDKIKRIKNILLDFVDKDLDLGLDKDYLLDNLSNEITNDNIENTIINNLIVSENFNSEEIVKRSTESVWLNIGDIKKWFKKIKM